MKIVLIALVALPQYHCRKMLQFSKGNLYLSHCLIYYFLNVTDAFVRQTIDTTLNNVCTVFGCNSVFTTK